MFKGHAGIWAVVLNCNRLHLAFLLYLSHVDLDFCEEFISDAYESSHFSTFFFSLLILFVFVIQMTCAVASLQEWLFRLFGVFRPFLDFIRVKMSSLLCKKHTDRQVVSISSVLFSIYPIYLSWSVYLSTIGMQGACRQTGYCAKLQPATYCS